MNPVAQSPLFVRAGAGHFADLGDHRAHIKVSADHIEGVFMLIETDADFNGGVPPHIHRIEDETFFMLSGRIEFGIGDQVIEAGPGDTVFAPRNIEHTWHCTSPEGAKMLIWFTPGDNFQAFGLAMAAGRRPARRDGGSGVDGRIHGTHGETRHRNAPARQIG
ncbi:MAG: cupin domain-containing protein [Akkermansiaceae bacterium]|nr:cupin domain-containing protein [Armatimonadota bacterium]